MDTTVALLTLARIRGGRSSSLEGKSMRVTILAIGTRGDVQPYVALGLRLQDCGDEVCLATHQMFEHLVTDAGLPFSSVAGNPKAVLSELTGTNHSGRRHNLRYAQQFARAIHNDVAEASRDCLDASHGADLVVASPLAEGLALHIHEKIGAPICRTYFMPWAPSRYYSALLAGAGHLPQGRLSLWSHYAIRELLWLIARPSSNRARTEVFGLKPLSLLDPFRKLDQRRWPTLLCLSPHVFPPAPDWGPSVQATGFWFLDRPSDWCPPAELVRFLDAGPPPVSVGFGSIPHPDPEKATEMVIAALRRADKRGVLVTGWDGFASRKMPEDMYMLKAIPYDWLFPRMAAVVHHGGAGTTASGLRAGVPTVVVPAFADQPFWGRRIHELGVGPQPIPRHELTVERLAAAVSVATNDPDIRRRAHELGEAIRAEDGVGRAVEFLHDFVRSGRQSLAAVGT